MISRITLTIMILTILCLAGIAHGGINFIYPQPKSWVSNPDHLILKLNSFDLSGVRVTVNGLASDILPIGTPEYRKEFQDFLVLRASWDPGSNEVLVEGFKGGQKTESASTTIFYNVNKKPAAVPPDFRPNRFHTPEQEKLCTLCHQMNPAQAQLGGGNLDKSNPCYSCHKRMLETKFVHGPAGTFSCGYCHVVASTPRYATPKREMLLCNECHAEKNAEFKKRKFLHGPIDAGMCEVCHDPHGSPYPAQLKMPINKLCLSCHGSVGDGMHVVRTSTGKGHPLEGVNAIPRSTSGKEMSCVSCHNPHSSDVRYFFVNNAEDKMMLCQMCHNK